MIVITSKCERTHHVLPGDEFQLTVGEDLVIHEVIKEHMILDFIVSFRFAAEDGTCYPSQLSGFFGSSKQLPPEMQAAVHMDDLEPEKYKRFMQSLETLTVFTPEEQGTRIKL